MDALVSKLTKEQRDAQTHLGKALTELLGLPEHWCALSLVWRNNENWPMVEIEVMVLPYVVVNDDLKTEFKRFRLVPAE